MNVTLFSVFFKGIKLPGSLYDLAPQDEWEILNKGFGLVAIVTDPQPTCL